MRLKDALIAASLALVLCLSSAEAQESQQSLRDAAEEAQAALYNDPNLPRGWENSREAWTAYLREKHGWTQEKAERAIAAVQALYRPTGPDPIGLYVQVVGELKLLKGAKPTDGEVALQLGWTIPAVIEQRLAEEAKQELAKINESKDVLKRLKDSGFHLRRSIAGADISKPAVFSLLKTAGEDTVYAADFAFVYDFSKTEEPLKRQLATTFADWQLGVEGRLSSDESESENALRFQGTLNIYSHNPHLGLQGSITSLSLRYETDQDFDSAKILGEVLWTPIQSNWFIGEASGDEDSPIRFRWRPFFGASLGANLDAADSAEQEDTLLRLSNRVRADLYLESIKRGLGLYDLVLYVDNAVYYLPLEDDDTHNLFTAGINFQLHKNVSIDITYKNGEAPPLFGEIETFGVSVGIRF